MTHSTLKQYRSLHSLGVLADHPSSLVARLGHSMPGRQWGQRAEFRAELRRLLRAGEHLIEDIGLSHEQALREASKPFWVK